MEAGLACPDWPFCFGSLFPKGQMNLKVFLEWFHRLDAFFVGIAICLQWLVSLVFKSHLPKWTPWVTGSMLLVVILQGSLGALTVIELLPSTIVMSHLLLGLTLIALMSGFVQRLLVQNGLETPFWWKFLSGASLLSIIVQSLIGSRMATTWSVQRCINHGIGCHLLDLHRISALPVVLTSLLFVITAFLSGGWFRTQWPYFLFVLSLIGLQITIGILSVHLNLNEPFLRILHQLIASLLVASLSALYCRKENSLNSTKLEGFGDHSLEVCHG